MRLLSCTLMLVAFVVFGHDVATGTSLQIAAGTDTSWTAEKPLTGRAIPCKNGQIKIFSCQRVELLAYLPRAILGNSAGNDIWGWTDSATGREFVIIGDSATAFVEVTDPVNPKYLGILPPHAGVNSHAAQSVKVYKNHALIGYEGAQNGMQVFDLTQLRKVEAPPVVFQETAHYSGITNTHTIAINPETGFAYANGSQTCGGGLHMIDVRTPTTPVFAGCYAERGWIHDTQCVVYRGSDAQYEGREICFIANVHGVVIVDVTDKQQPKTLGVAGYSYMTGGHQGWLTEDHRYFFLDDEADEGILSRRPGPSPHRTRTIIFDVMDLDDPVMSTEYLATTTATDHNLYIRGRYMYQSNYGAGLRIIDIANPKQPKEVGYLTNIGDAWGAYPYFKNDVIAVSVQQTGLFLVRLLKR